MGLPFVDQMAVTDILSGITRYQVRTLSYRTVPYDPYSVRSLVRTIPCPYDPLSVRSLVCTVPCLYGPYSVRSPLRTVPFYSYHCLIYFFLFKLTFIFFLPFFFLLIFFTLLYFSFIIFFHVYFCYFHRVLL